MNLECVLLFLISSTLLGGACEVVANRPIKAGKCLSSNKSLRICIIEPLTPLTNVKNPADAGEQLFISYLKPIEQTPHSRQVRLQANILTPQATHQHSTERF